MKKLMAIAIALLTVFSLSTVALAENTTVLTTTVPDAEYKLIIPNTQVIDFGATSTQIEVPTVTEASGFAEGKDLEVSVTYTNFESVGVSTTIPISLTGNFYNPTATSGKENQTMEIGQGAILVFEGLADKSVSESPYMPTDPGSGYKMNKFYVNIKSSDWGKALGGDYTATITFTAEVVAE